MDYGRSQMMSRGGTYVKSSGIMGPEATTDNNCVKSHLKGDHYPLSPLRPGVGGGGVYADIRPITESYRISTAPEFPERHTQHWGGGMVIEINRGLGF